MTVISVDSDARALSVVAYDVSGHGGLLVRASAAVACQTEIENRNIQCFEPGL